jgi:multiple sugar transport system substrate-binding protein
MDDITGFKHYLREKGTWLYNDAGDGLGYTDDQDMIWYFDYFNKLREAGIVPNQETELGVKGLEDSLIVHKKAAMQSFNSNQLVALASAAGRPLKLMMYPTLPGGQPGHFIKPSQLFSIYSCSKHQKVAAEFINYFTNELEANKVLSAERGVPVPAKVREALYPNLSPAEKTTFDYVESIGKVAGPINPPDPERSPKVGDLFTQIQQAVNYGKLTPEQAAKQFREQASQDLKGP